MAARLDDIPGINLASAYVILAEIGTGMTRFPTAGHLASWAPPTPGISESAGKKKGTGLHRARERLPGSVLGNTAAGCRQDRHVPGPEKVPAHRPAPRLQARHRRPRPLNPGDRLAPAVHPETRFYDLGPGYHAARIDPERRKRTRIRELEALGYTVTLKPAA